MAAHLCAARPEHRLLHVVLLLSLLLHHAESLDFHYDAISRTNAGDFGALGDDCTIGDDGADLTGRGLDDDTQKGRLIYPTAVRLWDPATGEEASFSTNFTFRIDEVAGLEVGDGMAFFLAGQSVSPSNSDGGYLGLIDSTTLTGGRNATGDGSIVAIEFDTVRNEWDPSDRHIGLDVNNVNSFEHYTTLSSDSLVGRNMSVQIDYDNSTKQLSVVLFNARSDQATYSLSATVNLRELLPEQVTVGFSAATNQTNFARHHVLSWSFRSTLDGSSSPSHRNGQLPLVAGATVAAVALLLCAVVGTLVWRSRRRRRREDQSSGSSADGDSPIDEDLESMSGPRPFLLSKLRAATANFSQEEKLGQGASGSVYRGRMDDGGDVAIKVFSRGSSAQGKREYTAEVTVISRLRHRNLVQLIGWRHGRKKLLLVYELMPNASLDRHLYCAGAALAWPERHRIVLGLGAAVLYLHEEWEQCVVHGDIKPSNIMLDESFEAKLGDFGLARLIDHGVGLQTMTAVAGTPGYLDPECIATGKASTESDVYSFGVVLLEVATGRRPMAAPLPGSSKIFRLVEWAWDLYGQGRVRHAADEALAGEFDEAELERVVVIGLWCAHPDATARPSIREAVEALRSGEAAKLPALPHRMPVAMYVQPFARAENFVVSDEFTASRSVTSSHSHGGVAPAADDSCTSSSIPPAGSKESVRLLKGR